MMRKLIFILSVTLSLTLFSQENSSKFDFRIGAGSSFMGSGDMTTTAFENELNYRVNNYFTISPSIICPNIPTWEVHLKPIHFTVM